MSGTPNATYKLNRLFNIFDPRVYKNLLLANVLLAVVAIVSFFYQKMSLPAVISTVVVTDIIFIISQLLNNPKKFHTDTNNVEFNSFVNVGIGRHVRWVKVSYSVSDITELKFHQNAIEKMFDVGHITFKGNATFTAKQRYTDRIPDKNSFTIYGIKDFTLFKSRYNK